MCGVFLSFFKSQHVFVAGNTYKNLTYVYDNRHNMFDGVKVSECQGKDASQRRVYYLSFGTPEVGENGGNTARNTHQVLKLVANVMKKSAFHQDGGWTQAIRVSKCARFLRV